MTDVATLDSLAMFAVTAALPDHIERAMVASRNLEGLPAKQRVANIVVLGMGGSGIAGDVLVAAASSVVPLPITVVKGYELPAFVGEGSLVFTMSFSGDTEETVEAATEAARRGAKIVVVTSNGRLAELAASWGSPVVRVPRSIPQPRAAIGALATPPIAVLEEIGLFPGATRWIELAVQQLRKRNEELLRPGNLAEQLAGRFVGKLVLTHGAGAVGAAAAQRWKTQINENAKSGAFWATQPEVCHNEVVGWEALAGWTREKVALVALRHDGEHPQVARRFELVEAHVRPKVAFVENVRAEGDGDLAQLFDLVLLGDYVSLHMAIKEGVDPGPVPYLTTLKTALSQR